MKKQKYCIIIIYEHKQKSLFLELQKKLQDYHPKLIKQKNISLVSEPNCVYIKSLTLLHISPNKYQTVQEILITQSIESKFHYSIQTQKATQYPKKFLLMDMDSTFIEQEVIDEIAKATPFKKEVQHTTKEAMQGNITFQEALEKRMKLLKGVHKDTLLQIQQSLITTFGAKELLNYCKQHKIKVGIVSGGFTYFTNYLQKKFSLDFSFANQIEIGEDNKITGSIIGTIITKEKKKAIFLEKLQEYSILPEEAIAIGDGANDIEMLQVAGVGIAFCANSCVIKSGNAAIQKRNLEITIHLL